MWKEIQGYEGLYSINELGEVLSHGKTKCGNRGGIRKDKILKTNLNKYGYLTVSLQKSYKVKTLKIHRLVALYFIPNPENKEQVNHKNGIKTDNSIQNLEWVTHSENIQHSYTVLKRVGNRLGLFGIDNDKSKKVKQYSLDGNLLNIFSAQKEAERETGIRQGKISSVCLKKAKSAGGYYWEFA